MLITPIPIPPSQEVSFLEFLVLLPKTGIVFWIKIVFIILNLLLFGGILWLLFNTSWFKEHYGQNFTDLFLGFFSQKGFRERRWLKIKKKAESNKEAERKLAIIEAEELLDAFLKQRKISGSNLRERFRTLIEAQLIPPELYQILIQASQVVDDIIYDPDFELSKNKAKETLAKFERVLNHLTEI